VAEVEADLADVSAILRRTEAERLAERAAAQALIQEIEDAARADPDADRVALPARSVQRLRDRWGAP
jgi:hypothetical protein